MRLRTSEIYPLAVFRPKSGNGEYQPPVGGSPVRTGSSGVSESDDCAGDVDAEDCSLGDSGRGTVAVLFGEFEGTDAASG